MAIFCQFYGYISEVFLYFAKQIFAWSSVLLMYNTTIFEKIYFWPLFVTFEVTALVGKRFYLKNSNEFRLFIYWSNFRTAEIGQTLVLVKKALFEQTLIFKDIIIKCTVKNNQAFFHVKLLTSANRPLHLRDSDVSVILIHFYS